MWLIKTCTVDDLAVYNGGYLHVGFECCGSNCPLYHFRSVG